MTYEFHISNTSSIPKYRQIVESVINGIKSNRIPVKERLPSINEFSMECDVSRDTVEKAYRQLKQQGIVISVPGKGYFTTNTIVESDRNILLLFNKLSAYKKAIFEGFMKVVGEGVKVDIQIYHENLDLFRNIIEDQRSTYSDYVIIPAFRGRQELEVQSMLNNALRNRRIWILNTHIDGLKGLKGEVVQNYESDIFNTLKKGSDLLEKYDRLTLVFPGVSNYSRNIVKGFQNYCRTMGVNGEVIWKDLESVPIQYKSAYIVLLDHDLVTLVKKIRENNWQLGQDIGLLAYNDSPLKEVLMDGISVISTDHYDMGRKIANMILKDEQECIENRFDLILRNSL